MSLPIPLPIKIYASATLQIDQNGLPEFLGDCGRSIINGPINLAIRDGAMLKHYFHWIEMFLGAFIVHQEYFSNFPVIRLFVGRQLWNNPKQNHVQANILRSIYGDIEVVTGSDLEGTTLENVICIDRQLFHIIRGIPNGLSKFLEPFLPIGCSHAVKFRHIVVRSVPTIAIDYNAVHVRRNPPRAFIPEVAVKINSLIHGDTLDFSDMNWESQVAHSANTRILYGVHGNGLTNMIWMRPGSTVFEFFPAQAHHYDYQLFAELFGLRYFGFQGKNVWREFSRHGDPFGHGSAEINVAVEDVNWTALQMAINVATLPREENESMASNSF